LIRQLAVEFSGWAAEPTLWQEDYSTVVWTQRRLKRRLYQ
jgi:hypothetical protein